VEVAFEVTRVTLAVMFQATLSIATTMEAGDQSHIRGFEVMHDAVLTTMRFYAGQQNVGQIPHQDFNQKGY